MHLLDTDTVTHLHAGHPRVVAQLAAVADPDVGTTIITRIEILRGRFDFVLKAANGDQLLRAEALLNRTEELLEQTRVVGFDDAAAREFERLQANQNLRTIERAALRIASI